MIRFEVPGIPVPQGSVNAFVVNGRAVISHQNSNKLKAWRNKIAKEAEKYFDEPVKDLAIMVILDFWMPRPKSVTREFYTVKPDLDKLIRAVLDSLTGVVYDDDKQVISIIANKIYVEGDMDSGVIVSVSMLE